MFVNYYLPVVLLILCMWCECHATTANNTNNHLGDFEDGLFEGDLKIPIEMIMAHYNLSSIPEGIEILGNDTVNESEASPRSKRAATASSIKLWPNRIVRYRISSNISSSVAMNISTAITKYQSSTCLHFIRVIGGGDFIDFVSTSSGCKSNSVGRKGGKQFINLQNPGCTSVGIIIHEIGHAIGFWHEQSRPDRDQYVDIHWNNIRNKKSSQFMKRKYSDVDYQGSGYDYGSIMHYPKRAFSKNITKHDTITANNPAEYSRQGSPTLGNRVALSAQDIFQVKRLYSCPGGGVRGILTVKVRRGNSLRYTNGRDIPDPYVIVTAVDSSGGNVTLETSRQQNRRHPVWNQTLNFGNRNWQFFRISAWDADSGNDDQVTMTKTVSVSRGNHYSLKTCENTACSSYILYDYYLNERATRNLRVYARYAHNLSDRDGWFNKSDPYMEVTAVDVNGNSLRRTTRYVQGNHNHNWNQYLYFGRRAWRYFRVRIYDDDPVSDDALSSSQTIYLSGSVIRTHVTHQCYSGYAVFNYYYN